MLKVTVREDGFEDASKEYVDEIECKAALDPPIDHGKEFELEFEFDDPFEPKEYLEIIPPSSAATPAPPPNENQATTARFP